MEIKSNTSYTPRQPRRPPRTGSVPWWTAALSDTFLLLWTCASPDVSCLAHLGMLPNLVKSKGSQSRSVTRGDHACCRRLPIQQWAQEGWTHQMAVVVGVFHICAPDGGRENSLLKTEPRANRPSHKTPRLCWEEATWALLLRLFTAAFSPCYVLRS